jgi:AcrR family transcriptional regulator
VTPKRTKSSARARADVTLEKTGARWDAILEAAAEEFASRGFASVRLEDVAARVGLLKGSLYYYFDAKEDLFYAVIERSHLETLRLLREDSTSPDLPAGIRLRAFIERWMCNPRRLKPWPAGFEHDYHHLRETQRRRIYELRGEIVGVLQSIIDDGIRTGEFNKDFAPQILANITLQMLVGTDRWRPVNSRVTWKRLADDYWLIVSRALGADTQAALPGETDSRTARESSASGLPARSLDTNSS